ncbi:DUF4327 family protein [Nodosilinea sp. LEGE 07298]|jgi:hypothetical protein|uniref:DUF4327 family protein n=1 Tax=Nodosilinea sp. LEGE 07298 TaxID=2777970 RepID=UPI001882CD86|nr:DUF4327 family protein [Nodosilinea sp. LEGE 07298]MBE9108951.1 DUF4327 family protein [Nodosilinea sp. LEGE 07298]
MTTTAIKSTLGRHYTIDAIRDEAKQLVDGGTLDRCQPICALCGYIAAREWPFIEAELEENDYCLRDRIGDLIPHETWSND